jgi:dihydroorotase
VKLIVRNARIVDPATDRDGKGDLYIADGRIAEPFSGPDKTIDARGCLCSDHTPVDEDGKHLPFAEAEPGATGLELLLPLTLRWGEARKLSLAATLARITCRPARVLGVPTGRLAIGAPADVVLFDPAAPRRIAAETLKSQGKNTPFLGHELAGKVRYTIVAGNVVYEQ